MHQKPFRLLAEVLVPVVDLPLSNLFVPETRTPKVCTYPDVRLVFFIHIFFSTESIGFVSFFFSFNLIDNE